VQGNRKIFLYILSLALIQTVVVVSLQSARAATITVNTTADELNRDGDCSLREAIQAANTNAAVDARPAGSSTETDTITFAAATDGLRLSWQVAIWSSREMGEKIPLLMGTASIGCFKSVLGAPSHWMPAPFSLASRSMGAAWLISQP
jgi:CSLREA domain-containing protein